jgi:hypothetical protein
MYLKDLRLSMESQMQWIDSELERTAAKARIPSKKISR